MPLFSEYSDGTRAFAVGGDFDDVIDGGGDFDVARRRGVVRCVPFSIFNFQFSIFNSKVRCTVSHAEARRRGVGRCDQFSILHFEFISHRARRGRRANVTTSYFRLHASNFD